MEKIDNYFELTGKLYVTAMWKDDNSNKVLIFCFPARGTSVLTEFRGAVATFLTMAYILAVNPRILAESGGTCSWCEFDDGGPDCAEYEQCMEDTKRKFVVATAMTSMVACLIMGLWANLPIALR